MSITLEEHLRVDKRLIRVWGVTGPIIFLKDYKAMKRRMFIF